MRVRLREKYTEEELSHIYDGKHDHTKWNDHKLRIAGTIALAQWVQDEIQSVADLSAGDATVINALKVEKKYVGDYVQGYEYTGAIEDTLDSIPNVDLYICTETLEHLDDPDIVLKQIRAKSKLLILSTPIGESNSENAEHYWGWDEQDIKKMLLESGWRPRVLQSLIFEDIYEYNFQLWLCE